MYELEDGEVQRAVDALAVLRRDRKAIESEEAKLKPIVRSFMEQNGLEKAKTFQGSVVTCKPNVRHYLDKEAVMRDLGIESLDSYHVETRVASRVECTMPKPSKRGKR